MKGVKRTYITVMCAGILFAAGGCSTQEENEPVKLTWYVRNFQHVAQTSSNFAENALYKELMERLNIEIEFIHPSGEMSLEALKSSDNLPDIIEGDFTGYPGGPQAAINDGIIIELDPYLAEYSPDYLKVLEEHPEWDRDVTTDDGTHYTYAWLRGDESLLYWSGLIVRSDILEELNLKTPVTIDDWEIMLSAFKEYGVKYPLSAVNDYMFGCYFMSAYGIGEDFYHVDGTVKYAPMEGGYCEYLTMLKRWYDNGWIDPEFYTQSEAMMEHKIKNGEVGAFIGSVGGNMGNCISSLAQLGGSLMGVSIPVLNEGDPIFQGARDSYYQPITSVSISADCQNKEEAAKLLNYGYTDEGHMLYNFGIEGVSYQIQDGYPYYTDLITKNPDGLSMQYAMSMYMASTYGGPFIQDKREYEQYLLYPEQKEAVALWSSEPGEHWIPEGAIASSVENDERIISDYCNTQSIKFIVGERSLDEYDEFTEELRALGVENVINAKQAALQRYYNK